MTIPPVFSVDFFNNSILGLSKMNRTGQYARIRITIYRNEGGLYAPDTNSVSWLIECNPLTGNPLSLNKKGLNLGIYEEIFKPINKLSNLKTANGLIFVMAGIFKKENALDEAVLLNDSLNIVEAISSNIFIVKNRILYTPALSQGCVAGVMRAEIIKKVMAEKINCFEAVVSREDLLNADEVFLTNAIRGIQWVSKIQETNYSNRFTKWIKELVYR